MYDETFGELLVAGNGVVFRFEVLLEMQSYNGRSMECSTYCKRSLCRDQELDST